MTDQKPREITKLKKKAKKLYVEYVDLLSGYSCGATLAEHIDSRISSRKQQIQNIFTELKALGENVPEF